LAIPERALLPAPSSVSLAGTTSGAALTDDFGRPRAFLLSPGQAADCRAGEPLLRDLPPECLVIADRAYDTDAVRQQIEAQGAAPNIPSKRNRRGKACFSPVLYRGRTAIERMFCRLKDWRRVATRYHKLAATHLAAIVSYWV
jgi:transposase